MLSLIIAAALTASCGHNYAHCGCSYQKVIQKKVEVVVETENVVKNNLIMPQVLQPLPLIASPAKPEPIKRRRFQFAENIPQLPARGPQEVPQPLPQKSVPEVQPFIIQNIFQHEEDTVEYVKQKKYYGHYGY